MTGRVIIVTGGNSGIGFEIAKYLAEGGNDVILACRNQDRGDEAVAKIKALHPNSLVQCMQVDLSSLASIQDFAKEFMKKKRKLNVLINNAAIALNSKDLTLKPTSDGLEITMATNHFGPFLLTNLLSDYLIQTARMMGEGRIINVTCAVHDHENNWSTRNLDFLDMENFQLEKPGTFNGLQAYKNSKLCNVLMSYYLAETLRNQNVMVNAVDPGMVPKTRLYRKASQVRRAFNICCLHHMLRCVHLTRTVRQAALHIVDLAVSEKYDGETGKYYRDGVVERSSTESYDHDLQRAVWRTSCNLVHCVGNDDTDEDSIG
jgi:NAD(P)-dependent dehydrogenase (short-subunit alcohol dehydrogenase family)